MPEELFKWETLKENIATVIQNEWMKQSDVFPRIKLSDQFQSSFPTEKTQYPNIMEQFDSNRSIVCLNNLVISYIDYHHVLQLICEDKNYHMPYGIVYVPDVFYHDILLLSDSQTHTALKMVIHRNCFIKEGYLRKAILKLKQSPNILKELCNLIALYQETSDYFLFDIASFLSDETISILAKDLTIDNATLDTIVYIRRGIIGNQSVSPLVQSFV